MDTRLQSAGRDGSRRVCLGEPAANRLRQKPGAELSHDQRKDSTGPAGPAPRAAAPCSRPGRLRAELCWRLFWVHMAVVPLCPVQWEGRGGSVGPFYQGTDSIMAAPPSWPDHCPLATSQHHHLGMRPSMWL